MNETIEFKRWFFFFWIFNIEVNKVIKTLVMFKLRNVIDYSLFGIFKMVFGNCMQQGQFMTIFFQVFFFSQKCFQLWIRFWIILNQLFQIRQCTFYFHRYLILLFACFGIISFFCQSGDCLKFRSKVCHFTSFNFNKNFCISFYILLI